MKRKMKWAVLGIVTVGIPGLLGVKASQAQSPFANDHIAGARFDSVHVYRANTDKGSETFYIGEAPSYTTYIGSQGQMYSVGRFDLNSAGHVSEFEDSVGGHSALIADGPQVIIACGCVSASRPDDLENKDVKCRKFGGREAKVQLSFVKAATSWSDSYLDGLKSNPNFDEAGRAERRAERDAYLDLVKQGIDDSVIHEATPVWHPEFAFKDGKRVLVFERTESSDQEQTRVWELTGTGSSAKQKNIGTYGATNISKDVQPADADRRAEDLRNDEYTFDQNDGSTLSILHKYDFNHPKNSTWTWSNGGELEPIDVSNPSILTKLEFKPEAKQPASNNSLCEHIFGKIFGNN